VEGFFVVWSSCIGGGIVVGSIAQIISAVFALHCLSGERIII